jgi:hypothetical protein
MHLVAYRKVLKCLTLISTAAPPCMRHRSLSRALPYPACAALIVRLGSRRATSLPPLHSCLSAQAESGRSAAPVRRAAAPAPVGPQCSARVAAAVGGTGSGREQKGWEVGRGGGVVGGEQGKR